MLSILEKVLHDHIDDVEWPCLGHGDCGGAIQEVVGSATARTENWQGGILPPQCFEDLQAAHVRQVDVEANVAEGIAALLQT